MEARARLQGTPMPDYVPEAIRDDYTEACVIRDGSPKASATLCRRALQGMIRNFWGITERTLKLEIDALQDKVESQTWEAIDAVREVGNIGAHTEKDVNVIIDVEPHEADQLIWLVETLISDWYINKHEREQHLTELKALADQKKQEQDAAKGQPPTTGTAP